MHSDARVQTDTLNDFSGIQSLRLRIRVQLIEIADPERQVGIRKEFDRLRFGESHKEGIDILPDRAFFQQFRKLTSGRIQLFITFRPADNNPAWIQVVI